MELQEKIARLIDPTVHWDDRQPRWIDEWHRAAARAAARRVIDGLDILRDHDPQEDA